MAVVDRTAQTEPVLYKIKHVRGDTFTRIISVGWTGYNFAGTTARSQFKKKRESSTALVNTTPILDTSTLGKASAIITVPKEQTNWAIGIIYADLELTFTDGQRITPAILEIEVINDVSRD
jgi:hypothetical protein